MRKRLSPSTYSRLLQPRIVALVELAIAKLHMATYWQSNGVVSMRFRHEPCVQAEASYLICSLVSKRHRMRGSVAEGASRD